MRSRKPHDMIRFNPLSNPAPLLLDSKSFRRGCAKFATGIAIASALDQGGSPHGLTVNSFTSVSCAPPLVLVCIDYSSNVLPVFRKASHYSLSVLNENQQQLSTKFAIRGQDRFDGVEWIPGYTGVPLIPGALAHFECKVTNVVEAGDHAVFIAEVVRLDCHDGKPLLYFDSGYRVLS
jgi:flavin reductase (DIM6/NTAB) family NADH-FMN oxidoreductase RutF